MKGNNFHHFIYSSRGHHLAMLLLGAAGVALWWTMAVSRWEYPTSQTRPASPVETSQESPARSAAAEAPTVPGAIARLQPMQAETYWVEIVGNDMVLIPQPVQVVGLLSKEAVLKIAFDELFANRSEMGFSTIPQGTRLLDLELRSDGVYVNLSREFASGGGSAAMVQRVGQVLFTASSLDPDEAVFLSVEGQPIDERNPLGGEGVVLKQPSRRRDFVSQYPMY